ncbi:hypothetical protein GCM10025780_23010 [Frondihabitans cladoniiphilus]|uniref:Uncharacterized protein n=1 Tax=Frondihabitans cladoniiphilus TaxID=715785 RepID=A0ABP8W082_9MICO
MYEIWGNLRRRAPISHIRVRRDGEWAQTAATAAPAGHFCPLAEQRPTNSAPNTPQRHEPHA